ncbi:20047_t:CDS:2 [Funneliformis geosporum]|uniref:1041_t:CDS:1 n=1 Tax=Funneliformis geosporum TaxID=1117311 RepID=A0A9W4WRF7_9GLOM|nr:1041_t:CDS:2 [Funneliformis geosporum]CAI2175329.1 20047_t:CDS:2 [Funneliformis geosporum]
MKCTYTQEINEIIIDRRKNSRKTWTEIANELNERFPGNRFDSKKIALHYDNINPDLIKGPLSDEEKRFINNWSQTHTIFSPKVVATRMNRPANVIKNYYYPLKHKQALLNQVAAENSGNSGITITPEDSAVAVPAVQANRPPDVLQPMDINTPEDSAVAVPAVQANRPPNVLQPKYI